MWNFLAQSQNWPFSSALALMLLFALFEVLGLLFGAGLSELLDSLLPEMEIDLGIDGNIGELPQASIAVRFLGWLHFGKVPALMILIAFLTSFGLLGLALQSSSASVLKQALPAWLASFIVLPLCLPLVRLTAGLLSKVIPKDETEAVSSQSFIGRVATITLGMARQGSPAQAKLKDRHGHTHYLMVEPDAVDEEFETGQELLIVAQKGSVFQAIRNTSEALSSF